MNKFLINYLKFWATIYLNRVKPEIVAITGSVGKTSAKEAIFEVLKVKFGDGVRKSAGNLNTETGVPLAILGYEKSPSNIFDWFGIFISAPFRRHFLKPAKILVLELAADKPGDIEYLTSFIHPKVAVLTNIGPSHLEKFGTMDKIIEEKSAILKSLTDGTAVINLDNDLSKKVFENFSGNKKSYGINNPADVVAGNIETKIVDFVGKTSFELKVNNESKIISQNTLGDVANVSASLAAAAVGLTFGLSLTEIAEGLAWVKSDMHRMQVLKGKNSTTIIDDSYNASPLSMKAALSTLKNLPNFGRKIAVIGDMKEIGSINDEAHNEIGQIAKEVADLVIAVGTEAKKYNAQEYFENIKEATEFLLKTIQPNDLILFKASRGIKLDLIVENLKA